jgi:hypothetical protein
MAVSNVIKGQLSHYGLSTLDVDYSIISTIRRPAGAIQFQLF